MMRLYTYFEDIIIIALDQSYRILFFTMDNLLVENYINLILILMDFDDWTERTFNIYYHFWLDTLEWYWGSKIAVLIL